MTSEERQQLLREMGAALQHYPSSLALCQELQASLKELLPHAQRDIQELNNTMVGNLYPSINNAKLQRAQAAITKAEQLLS